MASKTSTTPDDDTMRFLHLDSTPSDQNPRCLELELLGVVAETEISDHDKEGSDKAPNNRAFEQICSRLLEFVPQLPDAGLMAMPRDERLAFERAGWRFCTPPHGIVTPLYGQTTLETEDGTKLYSAVFRSVEAALPDGFIPAPRLFLGTNRILVTFEGTAETLSNPQLVLNFFGKLLKTKNGDENVVIRKRPKPKDMVEVASKHGQDPFAVAEKLAEHQHIERADPVLLECLGGRSQPASGFSGPGWHLERIRWQAAKHLLAKQEPPIGIGMGMRVRIAIIDNGFYLKHPDLKARIHESSGYFVCERWKPPKFHRSKTHHVPIAHGTVLAGLIAAEPYPPPGTGVAYDAQIIAISCLRDQTGSQETLARAICYAADPENEGQETEAADIIICTLGPNGDRRFCRQAILERAIAYAREREVPLFWAVPNGLVSTEIDQVVSHDQVVGVGQSNGSDLPFDTAFGPGLDLLAPGLALWSALPEDGFGPSTGTSNATAVAAGVAAIILGIARARRKTITASKLIELIEKTCRKPRGANPDDPRFGHGRVDALAAAEEALRF